MRSLLFALALVGLNAPAQSQVNQFVGTPPNATNFLDFDNPFVPSGPIASNDAVFTNAGIASVSLIERWSAVGDLMTAASNVDGQAVVSQDTVLTIAGPGEPLDNPGIGAGYDVSFAAPCSEFGVLFVDQINLDYTIELFSGGSSIGVGQFTYTGTFPSPPHYWTGPDTFDRITITLPATGGLGLDNFAFDVVDCIGTNFECPATVPNSSGNPAKICAIGSIVAADNDVTLRTSGMPTLEPTFGFFLNSRFAIPTGFNPPNSQGRFCILPFAFGRYNTRVFEAGGTGVATLELDLRNTPSPFGTVAVQAGETWYFTTWFRDTNPNTTSNFSDAVCITFR